MDMKIPLYFAGYWFSSILVTFMNKRFLTSSDFNFSILFVQNAVGALSAFSVLKLFCASRPRQQVDDVELAASANSVLAPSAMQSLQRPLLQSAKLRKVLAAMAVTFTLSLALNNICLRLITVSFFQVVRSLNLISTALFSYLLLGRTLSPKRLACLAVVVAGFLLTLDQEKSLASLRFLPVLAGLAAGLVLGLHSVLTRKAIDEVSKFTKNTELFMTFYINVVSLPLLFLASLFSQELFVLVFGGTTPAFWFYVALSGVLTFAIGFSSNGCIRTTSPLAHTISVQSKSVVQTLLASWYLDEVKSLFWWVGNLTVIFGAISYAVAQIKEQQQQQQLEAKHEHQKTPTPALIAVRDKSNDGGNNSHAHHNPQSPDNRDDPVPLLLPHHVDSGRR